MWEEWSSSFPWGASYKRRCATGPIGCGREAKVVGALLRVKGPFLDAIVLAGGRGVRLGGADKAAVVLGGRALLDRVLDAVGGAGIVVVVGPRRAAARAVTWAREEPPDGGPVAGIAAALPLISADLVAVLAVDLPFVEAGHVGALARRAAGHDGALLVDEEGRDQPLAAVYRSNVLRAAVDRLDGVHGASVSALVGSLDLARVAGGRAAWDCDTPEDVATAERALLGR